MDTAALEESVVASVRGTVLEIGAGSGANFDDFPTGIEWIGLEPDSSALTTLRGRARRFSRTARVIEGVAETIPLDDDSVDTVLGTFVLCSVEDPQRVLSEVKRVLKPGGRFAFLEHVAAPRRTFTRFGQRMMTLRTRRQGECDPVRDTADLIRSEFPDVNLQGYTIRGASTLGFGIPHIAGTATAA